MRGQLRTLWRDGTAPRVCIVDQTQLPHAYEELALERVEQVAEAIVNMRVRGAPLIGVCAAYGVALALEADASDAALEAACSRLRACRPTAVNLAWALDEVRAAAAPLSGAARAAAAWSAASALARADELACRRLGEHGLLLLREARSRRGGGPVRVLTHCNAGALATCGLGTALAPIYLAHAEGLEVFVWVDETRPRNQGLLTAWELERAGVPHALVVDNAGGHLMQSGEVDLCLVGTDRTAKNGDVCNKIGTYLKALAARDCGVPFYVAVPDSSFDWSLPRGVGAVPIEERSEEEVRALWGMQDDGNAAAIQLVPDGTPVRNPAFDVTPARLVSGLVTERGVCAASPEGLGALYPERAA